LQGIFKKVFKDICYKKCHFIDQEEDDALMLLVLFFIGIQLYNSFVIYIWEQSIKQNQPMLQWYPKKLYAKKL